MHPKDIYAALQYLLRSACILACMSAMPAVAQNPGQ